MLLIFLEGSPVHFVLTKVNFIDSPEAGHLVLVHLPDIVVLDGEDDEAVGVVLEKRLRKWFVCLSAIDYTDL